MNVDTLKRPCLLLTIALLVAIGGCTSRPRPSLDSEAHPRVNFGGSWQLDYRLSEDLYEKIETLQRMALANAQRSAPAANAGRGGPVVTVNNRPVNNIRAILSLGQLAEVISRTNVIEIEHTGEKIEITRKEDFPLNCSFYGGAAVPIADALGTELCGWDGHQLVFRIDLPDGFTIHHRLTLAPGRDKMNIATTVQSSSLSQPFTLNRVYRIFVPLDDEFECETTVSKGKSCRRASS